MRLVLGCLFAGLILGSGIGTRRRGFSGIFCLVRLARIFISTRFILGLWMAIRVLCSLLMMDYQPVDPHVFLYLLFFAIRKYTPLSPLLDYVLPSLSHTIDAVPQTPPY